MSICILYINAGLTSYELDPMSIKESSILSLLNRHALLVRGKLSILWYIGVRDSATGIEDGNLYILEGGGDFEWER